MTLEEVCLNFIGHFVAPGEAEPDDDADAKRAEWREYKRQQRAK